MPDRRPHVLAAIAVALPAVLLVLVRLVPALAAEPAERGGALVLAAAAFLQLALASGALAATDVQEHRLPNALVGATALGGGLALAGAAALAGRPERMLGALVGGATLFALHLALALARPGGMGLGDVKLAGALGMHLGWLGPSVVLAGALAAFLLGGGIAIAVLLARGRDRPAAIPFGPALVVGAWVAIGLA